MASQLMLGILKQYHLQTIILGVFKLPNILKLLSQYILMQQKFKHHILKKKFTFYFVIPENIKIPQWKNPWKFDS